MKSYPRKIRILYLGGLGNQLFQYFAAVQTSSFYHAILEHDFSQIDSRASHKDSDIRYFATLFENQRMAEQSKKIIFIERLLISITLRISWSYVLTNIINDRYLREDTRPQKFRNSKKTMIGYFQTSRFFNEWSQSNELTLKGTTPNSDELTAAYKLWAEKKFIALHIRGGDFLVQDGTHTTLSKEYYSLAIDSIYQKLPKDIPIVVFSNDRKHSETRIDADPGMNISFIDDTGLLPSEVLTIMSYAVGHIISNSTFSYWAARLSSTSKVVICPDDEILIEELETDYYPPHWERIRAAGITDT